MNCENKIKFKRAFLLFWLCMLVCRAQAVYSFDELTAREVEDDFKKRIHLMVGEASDRSHIPLVDTFEDWTNYKEWPAEFIFQNEKYHWMVHGDGIAEKVSIEGPDWRSNPFKSAREIPPVGWIWIDYVPENLRVTPRLSVSSQWSRNGKVLNKSVFLSRASNGEGESIRIEYYPSGDVAIYSRNMKEGSFQTDYFNKFGNIIGTMLDDSKSDRLIYKVGGFVVEPDKFKQMLETLQRDGVQAPFIGKGKIGEAKRDL